MADMYDTVARKYKDSPAVVFLFIAAFVMLSIGAWLFVEDTVSSKLGLEQLQANMNMNVQIFANTYWVMSLAPQVASIVFFYIYLSDTSKKWALAASIVSQGADFGADTWYRSNGMLLDNPRVAAASMILTAAYFSIGSEVFITVGFGLVLKLLAPALQTWGVQWDGIKKAWRRQYNGPARPRNDDTPLFKPEPKPNFPTSAPGAKKNNRPSAFPGNFPGPNDFGGG